ncbi:MAG: hypothetical protein LBN05_07360 [Oscillospiraceae bacterium]|jgi:hypothetical protein|nr:hypothetical protein [Oscillospiraceae bacterium]
MTITDIFNAIKDLSNQFVVGGGIVAQENNWLVALITTVYDWFAGLFV